MESILGRHERAWASVLIGLMLSGCTATSDIIPAHAIPSHHYEKLDHVKAHLTDWKMERFNSLEEINEYVNKVPFKSDMDNYGVSDYWATPREFFTRNAGDCEDYAIAKYALMLQNGLINPSDAHIILVSDKERFDQPHALLIVNGLVYDNQNERIVTVREARRRYDFLVEVKK